jgi:Family of unknown function (DUF5990)
MSAKKSNPTQTLPLRIVVVEPPPRTMYALQLGRDQHVAPTTSEPSRVTFDFSVDVEEDSATGSFRLRGPAVQGPLRGRFVYLGVRWIVPSTGLSTGGRVKVTLENITPAQIRSVLSHASSALEAEFEGTGRNGLPACASVKLIGGGWHVRE